MFTIIKYDSFFERKTHITGDVKQRSREVAGTNGRELGLHRQRTLHFV